MKKLSAYLPWIFRIFISLLFLVSALAKMFPVWAFELQMVDLGVASWCTAPYFARFIIAAEITLGIAILQPHFLRSLVIPATGLMLMVFTVHLSIQMAEHGAMSGNCGCFGQLIPMTPLEAFIKNIVLLGMLVYLFLKIRDRQKGKNKITHLIAIYLGSALLLFTVFPFHPCAKEAAIEPVNISTDTLAAPGNTNVQDSNLVENKTAGPGETPAVNPSAGQVTSEVAPGPHKVASRFGRLHTFSNRPVNLDNGKKILCFFAPGCDDCREAATQITTMTGYPGFPEVYVVFLNEETDKIPDFFKETKCKASYMVADPPVFWELLGSSSDVPGIFYLWNGNLIRFYEGTGRNRLDMEDLKRAL